MSNKDNAHSEESEITALADDELDAVAGGKPTPGKLNFEHYYDKCGVVTS